MTEAAAESRGVRWQLPARLIVGVVLLAIVLRSIDLREVLASFSAIHPVQALALCLTSAVDRLLMAYKWNVLLRSRGIRVSVWQAARLVLVGNLFGALTPGAISGDAYRVAALSPFKKTRLVVSTIVLERFIGLAVIGIFAAAALPLSVRYLGGESTTLAWIVVAGTAGVVVLILVSLRPSIIKALARNVPYLSGSKIAGKLQDLYSAYAESRKHAGALVQFALLTAVEVVVLVLMNYLAARALGIEVSFFYFLLIIPLLHILLRFPISFHGIGVFEGLFAYFMQAGGFSAADGLSIALLFRAAELVTVFLPAGVILWVRPVRIQPDAVDPS